MHISTSPPSFWVHRSVTVPASAKMSIGIADRNGHFIFLPNLCAAAWARGASVTVGSFYSILYRFSGKLPNKVETDTIYLGNE